MNSEKCDDFSYDFKTIKAAAGAFKSNKDFNKNDLLRFLSYLEGELQAREVVIAALKSERVKFFLQKKDQNNLCPPVLVGCSGKWDRNDPLVSLYRDGVHMNGQMISGSSAQQAAQYEHDMNCMNVQHFEYLEQIIVEQRQTHRRILELFKSNAMTAPINLMPTSNASQGNAGSSNETVEIECIRLRKELIEVKEQLQTTTTNFKQLQEKYDAEHQRQKQIVLLLLAERKKIIMKYVEEKKRSEDLAQILSEEKQRLDTLAEGLEEESKKSLRMEHELEEQMSAFEQERLKQQKQIKELEAENEALKATIANTSTVTAAPVATQLISSSVVSKIVQPTATVSSVPVSGPTTGIARSISPGQIIRPSGIATAGSIARKIATPLIAPVSNAIRTPPPIPPNKPIVPPKQQSLKSPPATGPTIRPTDTVDTT